MDTSILIIFKCNIIIKLNKKTLFIFLKNSESDLMSDVTNKSQILPDGCILHGAKNDGKCR